MSQRTHGDIVNTALSILAECVEGNASARLCFISACNEVNGLLGIFYREIVEHDTVYPTCSQHLVYFVEVSDLYLYFQFKIMSLEIIMTAVDGIGYAS